MVKDLAERADSLEQMARDFDPDRLYTGAEVAERLEAVARVMRFNDRRRHRTARRW